MQVMPIEAMIYMGNRLPHHEDDNGEKTEGQKRKGLEDINPSFKYYMETCRPNPMPTFTGHWPTYYKEYNNPSPLFDPNGMLFPLTCVPTPNGPTPGHLNYLA